MASNSAPSVSSLCADIVCWTAQGLGLGCEGWVRARVRIGGGVSSRVWVRVRVLGKDNAGGRCWLRVGVCNVQYHCAAPVLEPG